MPFDKSSQQSFLPTFREFVFMAGMEQVITEAESGGRAGQKHFEAACLCGGITLSYSGALGPANYCHCEDCRRANGSAFNIAVRVERKDLQVKAISELKSYKYASGVGKEIERCFCGTCGSPIFTLHSNRTEYAWVKAGIIKDPDVVKPAYESWVKDKVRWATISVTQSYEESRKAQDMMQT